MVFGTCTKVLSNFLFTILFVTDMTNGLKQIG